MFRITSNQLGNYSILNTLTRILFIPTAIFLASCSDSDSSSSEVNFDVNYVKNRLLQMDTVIQVHSLTQVLSNGLQGKDYDIDKLIIGRATLTETYGGEALVIAYSINRPLPASPSRVTALYVDIDNNADTGKPIASIGAEYVFLDDRPFNREARVFRDFHVWTGTDFSGSSTNGSSAYNNINSNENVLAATTTSSSTIQGLFGTQGVKGVFAIANMPDGDPNGQAVAFDDMLEAQFDIPL